MKKILAIGLCAFILFGNVSAAFAIHQSAGQSMLTSDMPHYPDDSSDGGPFIEPGPTPDPGPDSTDSGDSWDSDSSGGGFDGGGYGDVLF